jgi:hypothetical protein
VIRRLFWLLAGAVLGVTGYRRAGRFARSLRPASAVRPAGRVLRAVAWPGHTAGRAAGGAARSHVAPFLTDVRDGMEIYLDRHGVQPDDGTARPGPNLGGQHLAPRLPAPRGATGGRFRFDNAKDGR